MHVGSLFSMRLLASDTRCLERRFRRSAPEIFAYLARPLSTLSDKSNEDDPLGISELPAGGQASGHFLNRALGNAVLSGQFLLEGKHTEARGSSLVEKGRRRNHEEWKNPDQVPGPLHLVNRYFNFESLLKSNQPGAQKESNRVVTASHTSPAYLYTALPLP